MRPDIGGRGACDRGAGGGGVGGGGAGGRGAGNGGGRRGGSPNVGRGTGLFGVSGGGRGIMGLLGFSAIGGPRFWGLLSGAGWDCRWTPASLAGNAGFWDSGRGRGVK